MPRLQSHKQADERKRLEKLRKLTPAEISAKVETTPVKALLKELFQLVADMEQEGTNKRNPERRKSN
jgi:hypothetical protein